MNEMKNAVPCGNYEALITYLYDECEPGERETIAAHIAQCASCTEELQALRDTRAHLGAWTPPGLSLGFQITRTDEQPSNVLRPAAWWRRPLPAWAQVAAAVVIFAAGMSVNVVRSTVQTPAPVAARAPQPAPVVAASSRIGDIGVTRAEFARLDARLRSMEHADVQRTSLDVPRTATGLMDQRELFEGINALVDAKIAQSNLRVMSAVSRALDAHVGETTQRTALMEESQLEMQEALRGLGSRLAVRTSFQPVSGGR